MTHHCSFCREPKISQQKKRICIQTTAHVYHSSYLFAISFMGILSFAIILLRHHCRIAFIVRMAKVLEEKMKQNSNSSENIYTHKQNKTKTEFHLFACCAGDDLVLTVIWDIMGGISGKKMEFPNVGVQNSNRNNSPNICDSGFCVVCDFFFRNMWSLHAKSTNTIALIAGATVNRIHRWNIRMKESTTTTPA